jgi:hypothetical protein
MIAIVPMKDSDINLNEIEEKMKESPFQYKIFLTSNVNENNKNVVVVNGNTYYNRIRNALVWIDRERYNIDYIFKTTNCDNILFDDLFSSFKLCNAYRLYYFGKDLFTRLYFSYFNDRYFIHNSMISLLKEENNMEGDEQVGYYIYEKGIMPTFLET